MGTGRKTRLRRILRRKRVKRAIKAYGNYIAAGVLVFVVCVAVVGAAVKPTANTLPKNTPEPVQTTQPTGSTTAGTDGTPAAKRVQPDICRYCQSGTKNVCAG